MPAMQRLSIRAHYWWSRRLFWIQNPSIGSLYHSIERRNISMLRWKIRQTHLYMFPFRYGCYNSAHMSRDKLWRCMESHWLSRTQFQASKKYTLADVGIHITLPNMYCTHRALLYLFLRLFLISVAFGFGFSMHDIRLSLYLRFPFRKTGTCLFT